MFGCQPSTEPNKTTSPSDATKTSVAGENSSGEADRTKDNTKSQDGTKSQGSTTNPDAIKDSEGKPASETAIADTAAEAKQLITDCITNYGVLKSYQDEAVLHLSVPLDKDPILEIRPLKIAFERPNKLAMNIRSLRSMWSSQTFESVVGDGQYAPFDNQRAVRPLPTNINLSWLMEDHLSSVVPIPNVGLPLSIELLLAPNPLDYFFSSGKFSMLPKEVFDNVTCDRVEIIYNEGRFVFWVDRARKLILREELPIEIILATFPSLPPEFDRKQIRFSVDLVAARSNQSIDWSTWSLPRQANDMLVRRFANPPFRGLPREIGTALSPILLKDTDNKDVFDSSARKSPITLLAWIDNSNMSRAFVDDIRTLERALNNRGLQSSCQILLVSNMPADKMKVAMQAWNCDLSLAMDTNLELQKQCGVSTTFATVVIGRDNKLHMISEFPQWDVLPDLIQQLKDGVDLAARELKVAVDNESRYASRLHRNILDKEQIGKMEPIHQAIAPFPFFYHDMTRDWVVELEQPLAAAGGELYVPHSASDAIVADEIFAKKDNAYRVMTVLDETGGIFTVDQSGVKSLISSIPIELADNAIRIHVRPEPWTHGWVAVIPEGLPRFWFCVVPPRTSGAWTPTEAAQIKLDEGESIESSTWAMKDGIPLLCMTTNKSKLRIFDPTTQKLSNSKLESNVVSMVGVIPQLDAKANCIGWSSIWSDSAVDPLPGMSIKTETQQIPFRPEFGNWVWGMGKQGPQMVALQKLESGETGSIQLDANYKPLFSTALSVRPEQCRLLSAASLNKNQFYWLASAPNRVLHLQTQDGGLPDQMSFGERVFSATIVPDGTRFKLIVALEKEVSCWTVEPKPVR